MATFAGSTALVTGASSGLGAEFARQLAAAQCHLVLVARRADRLAALAAELRQSYGIRVTVIACDLSTSDNRRQLLAQLAQQQISIDILINNAGFGLFGEFAQNDWPRVEEMLAIDINAVTELAHLLLPAMKAKQRGFILNVASIGAFQATPLYAAYSAAKAYVLLFSEALHYELRHHGIHVSCIAPGITATEFLQVSGQQATLYQRLVMMQVDDVVTTALSGLQRNKAAIVPGLINKLTIWSARFIPRTWQTTLAFYLMRNPA